jgi:hypothetical protein
VKNLLIRIILIKKLKIKVDNQSDEVIIIPSSDFDDKH